MNKYIADFHNLFLLFFLVTGTFFTHICTAQVNILTNRINSPQQIFSESIKTVQFYREGWEMAPPILSLNEEQFLILSFDDLSEEQRSLSYTITHCNYDWSPSDLLSTEYLDGFEENQVYDYAFSRNTFVPFTNYYLTLPNEDVNFKVSGNYLLTVFENGDKNKPLLTRKFYITEQKVSIGGRVAMATFDRYRGTKQELRFTVAHPNFQIRDPHTEIHTIIQKNGRHDQIQEAKPSFIRGDQIVYENKTSNVFLGENEFRHFSLKSTKTAGLGLLRMEFFNELFHAELHPSELRRSSTYTYEEDINGRFFIKNDELDDPELQSDYIMTRFSLPLPYPLTDGGVYVFGQLSDWNCNETNRMTYNLERKEYEAVIPLKQGIYDYKYVYMPQNATTVESKEFEGSHAETNNEYTVFVYFKTIGGRYDKLIGVSVLR